MTTPDLDWPWTAAEASAAGPDETAALAARCFRGADGEQLLAYLRGLTVDRALGPDAPDAALRHLEGQRQLIRHLCHLVATGRQGPARHSNERGDDA